MSFCVAFRVSQSNDQLISSEQLKSKKSSTACVMVLTEGIRSSDVLSLHCGVPTEGESNLKSIKQGSDLI